MGEVVTAPKRIVSGQTVSAEKLAIDRQARFRPDREVVQRILYVMGVWASRCNIELHEFCFLPERELIECSDPDGDRTKFFQQMRAFIARSLNRHFGEQDKVYSGKAGTEPELLDGETVLDKCIDKLVAPVEHEFVRYAWDWPCSSWGLEYDVPLTIPRPTSFFRSKKWPDSVEIVLRRPQDVRPDLDSRQLRAEIRAEARRRQGDIVARMKSEGRSVLGLERVRKLHRRDRPPRCRGPRNREAIANGRSDVAVARAKAIYSDFVVAHERARQLRVRGSTRARFPYGTYVARVVYNLPCHGSDP